MKAKEITIEEMEKLPWVLGVFEDPFEVMEKITVVYKGGSEGMDEARKYHGHKINGKQLFFYGMAQGKTWNGITYE